MQLLIDLLQAKIMPWVQHRGIEYIFTAYPSWKSLQRSDPALPPGTSVSYKGLQEERVAPRNRRGYSGFKIEQHRWPKSRLVSANTPKLCFITEGPVAFQIADYIFHCEAGHGVLLPAGTPNPDGELSILDRAREHYNRCETLMIMPYRGSLNCWSTLQIFDDKGEFKRRSDTVSVTQSLVPPHLHRLVDETLHRQLNWETICNAHLLTIASLLHRELKELPVITGGDELPEESPKRTEQGRRHAIAQAEEYINANLRRPLTIEQVAQHVYMSRTTFTEQFRARTGKTFSEYLNDRRFEEVCHLLKGSDLAIGQICHQVGIKERSLRYLVQKRTGLSPGELRHRRRENL